MKNILRSTKTLPWTKELKDNLLLPLGCAFSLPFDESVSIEKYFLAVGEKIGCHNIIYGGKEGSRVIMHLSTSDKLHKFCAENRFITIDGKQFLITKLVDPGLLLLLYNVVPHLPNFVIEEELRKTLHLKSSIFRSKYGMSDPRLAHIMAYNREVYVASEDVENIPVFINVPWKSVVYKIHIFFDALHLLCILCGKEGHSPKSCVEAPIITRVDTLRYRYISRDSSGPHTEEGIEESPGDLSVPSVAPDPRPVSAFSHQDDIQLNDISKHYPSFSNSSCNTLLNSSASEERNTKPREIQTENVSNSDDHWRTASETSVGSKTDEHRQLALTDTLFNSPPPTDSRSRRGRIKSTIELTESEGNAEEIKSLAESVITFKGIVEGMLTEPGTPAGYKSFLLTPDDNNMTARGTRGCQTKILLTPGESADMMTLSAGPRVRSDSSCEPESKQQIDLPQTSMESMTTVAKSPRVKSETFCMADGTDLLLTPDDIYKGGTLTPQDAPIAFKSTKVCQMRTALNRLNEDLSALIVIMRGLEFASVNMQNRGTDILKSIELVVKNISDGEDEDSETDSGDEMEDNGCMTDDSLG